MGAVIATVHRAGERSEEFWSSMGPCFASREIRRDLPGLHDDVATDTWLVYRDREVVAAFCCLRIVERRAELCHCWVAPGYRGHRLARRTTSDRLRLAREMGCTRAVSVCVKSRAVDLLAAGFRRVGQRGRFARMESLL